MPSKKAIEVKPSGFALATSSAIDQIGAALAPGEQLSVNDLRRARVAPQGMPKFVLGDETVPEIMGAIMFRQITRAYWPGEFEGSQRPACSSFDAITGIGEPGGLCAPCEFSQWGSATNAAGKQTKGQACRMITRVLVLVPGQALPVVVVGSPTSYGGIRRYMLDMALDGKMPQDYMTRFTVDTVQNTTGVKYGIIRLGRDRRAVR